MGLVGNDTAVCQKKRKYKRSQSFKKLKVLAECGGLFAILAF
jgi:hypothetical protein